MDDSHAYEIVYSTPLVWRSSMRIEAKNERQAISRAKRLVLDQLKTVGLSGYFSLISIKVSDKEETDDR